MKKQKLTLGIFAHANAGKTTITEQLLVKTGTKAEVGRVDFGTTTTDNMEIEKQRGITVRAGLVSFETGNKIFQLIDTPGHIDFVPEVEKSATILDVAILVLSGVEGVEAQTIEIYKILEAREIPIIIFVNKMDRDGANLNKTVEEIKNNLTNKAILIEDSNLMNLLADFDEEILSFLIENNTLDKNMIYKKVNLLTSEKKIVPIYSGSGLKGIGIDDLLRALNDIQIKLEKSKNLSAFCFRNRLENGERKTFIKMLGGTISVKDKIVILDEKQTIQKIEVLNGLGFENTTEISTGDIAILYGVKVDTFAYIGEKGNIKINTTDRTFFSVSVVPEKQDERLKVIGALKDIEVEDTTINLQLVENSNEIKIDIIGDVQAEIIKSILERQYNLKIEFENQKVIFKETPSQIGTGRASYTGVSMVELKVVPTALGSGINFKSECNKNILIDKYQKQIERLVLRYSKSGFFGVNLTDCDIVLTTGKFDSVGSEPMHFNMATPIALARAVKNSKPYLLSPYSKAILKIPNSTKEAMNFINEQNLNVERVEMTENESKIVCSGYLENIYELQKKIKKLTSGFGKIEVSHEGFKRYYKDTDLTFSADSPFNEENFIINVMKGSLPNLDKQPRRKAKVKYSQRTKDWYQQG